MRTSSLAAALAVVGSAALALLPASCTTKTAAPSTYFETTISPILTTSCVRTNTGAGCHVADAKGNAFGNLDLSNYAGVGARAALLKNYGAYGRPALLVKNVPAFQISVQSFDGKTDTVTSDIKHTGGAILDPTASGYQVLARWIQNGATENNSGRPPVTTLRLPCNHAIPNLPGFDPKATITAADYATFQSKVNPVFQNTCSAGNCHGTQVNELYLTCGSTQEEVNWNYQAASDYLAQTAEQSELVRRPLDPAQGGSFHEGGTVFTSTSDSGYQGLLQWATEHGPPNVVTSGDCETNAAACGGFSFFTHRVQPILVKKGCMMLQCHSAAMFHDYRMRGGSGGSFSLSATKKNYVLSIAQLALESDDVMASRLVRKNLFRPELSLSGHQVGLTHRGGPLFEDFPGKDADGSLCDAQTYNYDTDPLDAIPPLCLVREWHKRERAARNVGALSAIVYVSRTIPGGPDRAQDFDVYSAGASLHVASATLAAGAITLGADAVVNTNCGLGAATADIRRPMVSWDGTKVAFAARSDGNGPLQVYELDLASKSCSQIGDIAAIGASANGLPIHNFDPVYAPSGAGANRVIVFASTRGSAQSDATDYFGPQRTPADPSKPNANLYVYEPDPASTTTPPAYRIRQATYLLNMERYPSFMQDGRILMTTEKREPGLYELALRRENLDGSDYHPLFAQRGSIGYYEAREPIELADKNFAAIFSDPGTPHGGGTLGIFNRSIGVDFTSTDPADFPIDGSVINPSAPASPEPSFFLHSLSFPDSSASGHTGQPTSGVYTSPRPLPDGNLLVSFGATADVGQFQGDYDVYVFDRKTGTKTKLVGNAGTAEVDAVAVYPRVSRGIFVPTGDEPNGNTSIHAGATETDVNILDMPMLASLLFQNTPTGRILEDFPHFDVYEDLPPLLTETSFSAANQANVAKDSFGQSYVRRRQIGTVPLAADGSAHFVTYGGLPLVLHLPDTSLSTAKGFPRFQREEMQFAPGEYLHQSFPRQFFDNMCGFCHGSVSGRAVDNATAPDILTQASNTASRTGDIANLKVAVGARGAVQGPPAKP